MMMAPVETASRIAQAEKTKTHQRRSRQVEPAAAVGAKIRLPTFFLLVSGHLRPVFHEPFGLSLGIDDLNRMRQALPVKSRSQHRVMSDCFRPGPAKGFRHKRPLNDTVKLIEIRVGFR